MHTRKLDNIEKIKEWGKNHQISHHPEIILPRGEHCYKPPSLHIQYVDNIFKGTLIHFLFYIKLLN